MTSAPDVGRQAAPRATTGRGALANAPARPRRSVSPRTAYEKRREYLISLGRWQPYTPAQPVRDHVAAVRTATGLSVTQFAAIAGLDQTTVNKIFATGQASVTTVVAAKILAVTVSTARPASGMVDATGARRRLQGPTWAGYTAPGIAAETGLVTDTVSLIRNGTQARILVVTSQRIDGAYRVLLRQPLPRDDPGHGLSCAQAMALAARRGWVSPWAWDDDIDDPAACPKGLRPETGQQ